MAAAEPDYRHLYVGDQLIASSRLRGTRTQATERFAALHEIVANRTAGPPLCLYHGGDTGDGGEIEVAVPVAQEVSAGEVQSRILEGGHMLCTTHRGPHQASGERGGLRVAWERLLMCIRSKQIDLETGPRREVYLEGPAEHGEAGERFVTELQVPLLLPAWLDRLGQGVERCAGQGARIHVLEGSERLAFDATSQDKARWAMAALDRLAQAVTDGERQREILAGCAHRFPKDLIAKLRARYLELGSLDQLLETMQQDATRQGRPAYASPKRAGERILVTKVPFDPAGRAKAKTAARRRARYCHCGLVRALIEAEETVSPTFCYCGAGWHQQLWEGVLGQPVRVELLESVLSGGDCCRFAIHLPPGVA